MDNQNPYVIELRRKMGQLGWNLEMMAELNRSGFPSTNVIARQLTSCSSLLGEIYGMFWPDQDFGVEISAYQNELDQPERLSLNDADELIAAVMSQAPEALMDASHHLWSGYLLEDGQPVFERVNQTRHLYVK